MCDRFSSDLSCFLFVIFYFFQVSQLLLTPFTPSLLCAVLMIHPGYLLGGKRKMFPYLYSYVPTQPLSVYPCLCICICIEIPPGFHSHLYVPVQCQIALCNMRTIIARYIYNIISLSTGHIVGI